MDIQTKPKRANPYAKASSLSKLFLGWMFPLFCEGYKKDLELEDMYDPIQADRSKDLGDKLERQWEKQLQQYKVDGTKPSLLKALWGVLGKSYMLLCLAFSVQELIIRIIQPLALKYLLASFRDKSDVEGGKLSQYMLTAAVGISTFASTCFHHPCFQYSFILAMRSRICCTTIIYRKILRLAKSAQAGTTVGQITNLLSNDVNRFDYNILFAMYIPMSIVQLIVYSYYLWVEFGYAGFTGIALIVFVVSLQYLNGRASAQYRLEIAQRSDERGRVMNEIIVAMKIIKQYAWEKPFAKVIHNLRKLEVDALKKRLHVRGFFLSMYMSILKLSVFFTLLVYVLRSCTAINSEKVFFLTFIYFVLIEAIVYMVPSAISGIGEIVVCLRRVETFLLLEDKTDELKNYTTTPIPAPGASGDAASASVLSVPKFLSPTSLGSYLSSSLSKKSLASQKIKAGVTMKSLCASWTGEKTNLIDVDFKVEGDKTVIVVGSVGSGKTSLLHVILGEVPITEGSCDVRGDVAYASQEPWVFPGSVRQNILFGREFDSERYDKVVEAAALVDDFRSLEFGDETIVGEHGSSLSGGQRARVNLARALYQNADIYLLDDPLSAVDTRVSRHLFEYCIKSHLKGKVRILATHQLQYLAHADYIIVLNNGNVMAQGTYKQLIASGVDFMKLVVGDEDDGPGLVVKKAAEAKVVVDLVKLEERKHMLEEHMTKGAVGAGVFWEYLMAAESPVFFFFLVVIILLCQIAMSGSEYYISYWTALEERHHHPNECVAMSRETHIYILGGLIALVVLFNIMRGIGFFTYCMRISVKVHDRMFYSLVRAPALFFDSNPSGRIMNRFSKDLSSMDELLPPTFFDMLCIFSQVAGVFAIVIATNYFVAAPTVVVLIVLIIFERFYVCTARDVKRLEGISKSPIFTHCSQTFEGLVTVRSNKAQPILSDQFDTLQDVHTSTWFLFFSSARCFGMWVEIITVIFLTIVSFSFLLFDEDAEASSIGLAITSLISITNWLQFGMRQSAEVENLMTSVERDLEYAKIEPEAPLDSEPGKKPPKDWPDQGKIEFNEVYLSYVGNDVLKNLTFEINPRQKIGVVGRTGAGKSSIIQALFRLTEPRGDILIDAVKTKGTGLHDLRKSISIIPQEPVLFSGTMRHNLDPFGDFTDDELWRVIEEVELKLAIPHLEYLVTDGGSNFSLGQRQLVCLARAILRNNRIIVMDEATANVDVQTDKLIQTTVRTKFKDCTIIAVAHRLNSVIDCDKILVLDKGSLMEFDHPHVLLKNKEGIFTQMVQNTGTHSEELLRKIAAETYHNKRPAFDGESVKELVEILPDAEKSS